MRRTSSNDNVPYLEGGSAVEDGRLQEENVDEKKNYFAIYFFYMISDSEKMEKKKRDLST